MKKIIGVSCIFLAVDQLIKNILILNMDYYSIIKIIPNFFNIYLIPNNGAAFNIFQGNRLFLILITIVFLNLIYFVFIKNQKLNKINIWVTGLLIGGILGNLVDRIFHGFVIDYISFSFGKYSWPIFNFADTCIILSIIMILIITIKGENNENQSAGRRYKDR